MAVTCGFTANGLFGAGRTAPGTGIFIVPVSSPGINASGGVALLANKPKRQVVFAGAGSDVMATLTEPMAAVLLHGAKLARSAERRGGEEWASKGKHRWS